MSEQPKDVAKKGGVKKYSIAVRVLPSGQAVVHIPTLLNQESVKQQIAACKRTKLSGHAGAEMKRGGE